MNRKIGIIIAALMLLLTVGWYVGSPWWTLRQMRSAAVEGNVDALASSIDFDRVRASLKDQMNAMITRKLAEEQSDNPFMAFGAMLAPAIVNNMVDALVTKEGMRQMVLAGRLRPRDGADAGTRPVDYVIDRDGLDRFIVTPEGTGSQASFLFERDGFGWTLVEVRLPDDALSGTAH
ncbi:DUF2939 domain-containing protein [Sphingomonas lacunae]|uniref:DUF2939 domain-containing protein n=1 Tax=Sphingomonas lacunae TaxID=2698828 RepID=A0A6M4AXF1_9SPHN|nr:DUF2939 domain-containing protein [Sphingomonas lacunae]QJQ31621.1 DUF2939 domain-containing protein [Sphingomonas lacunae]